MEKNKKKYKIIKNKIYPIFLLSYLLPITYFYLELNSLLIIPLVFIPIIVKYPHKGRSIKEILKCVGINAELKAINGRYLNYKQNVKGILKENGCDYEVIIEDDEKINLYAGNSTIFISKGFINFHPLDDRDSKIKILSIIGHEITHLRKKFVIIKEVIIALLLTIILYIIISLIGIYNPYVFHYILFLSFNLLLFYVFRKNEFIADEGGFNFAKNNIGIIEFLKTVDDSVEKGYKFSDKFYELFSFHPHSINRIKKLEKMKVKNNK